MKSVALLIALAAAFASPMWVSAAPVSADAPASNSTCTDKARTQIDLDQCAASDAHTADAELNKVYQQVLQKYAGDKVFIAKFKAAQRAWLAYRDAELAARFPADDKGPAYGSIYPVCADNEMEAMTRQRTDALRKWLTGPQEGDACAGSYRPNTRN